MSGKRKPAQPLDKLSAWMGLAKLGIGLIIASGPIFFFIVKYANLPEQVIKNQTSLDDLWKYQHFQDSNFVAMHESQMVILEKERKNEMEQAEIKADVKELLRRK